MRKTYVNKGMNDANFSNPNNYVVKDSLGRTSEVEIYEKFGAKGNPLAEPIRGTFMQDIEEYLVDVGEDLTVIEDNYIDKVNGIVADANKDVVIKASNIDTSTAGFTIQENLDAIEADIVALEDGVVKTVNDIAVTSGTSNITIKATDIETDVTGYLIQESLDDLWGEKQPINDSSLETTDKTVVGAINEVHNDNIIQNVKTNSLDDKYETISTIATLDSESKLTIPLPTVSTNINMFDNKVTKDNFNGALLDYVGSNDVDSISLKAMGDYVISLDFEGIHSNAVDTDIAVEMCSGSTILKTVTLTLKGGVSKTIADGVSFVYSHLEDEPIDVFFRHKASVSGVISEYININVALTSSSYYKYSQTNELGINLNFENLGLLNSDFEVAGKTFDVYLKDISNLAITNYGSARNNISISQNGDTTLTSEGSYPGFGNAFETFFFSNDDWKTPVISTYKFSMDLAFISGVTNNTYCYCKMELPNGKVYNFSFYENENGDIVFGTFTNEKGNLGDIVPNFSYQFSSSLPNCVLRFPRPLGVGSRIEIEVDLERTSSNTVDGHMVYTILYEDLLLASPVPLEGVESGDHLTSNVFDERRFVKVDDSSNTLYSVLCKNGDGRGRVVYTLTNFGASVTTVGGDTDINSPQGNIVNSFGYFSNRDIDTFGGIVVGLVTGLSSVRAQIFVYDEFGDPVYGITKL